MKESLIRINGLTMFTVLVLLLIAAGCGSSASKPDDQSDKDSWPAVTDEKLSGQLIIFHAGSLAVPFKEMADAFETRHPGIKIMREAAGSRACARKISDLDKRCDVMASADYTVIDTLLIPDHADWNIKLATNEMTLVYHQKSRGASEITAQNWPEILLRKEVAFGRSDPNVDPCGYRAVLTIKLAEKHYSQSGLAEKLLAKDKYIRPKETDLLALLEAGEIDYIFLYRSVAEQHKLQRLILPDQINLKKPELSSFYAAASVEISGKTPGSKITKKGAPMVYGVTIPRNAPNPKAALAFVEFLLARDGGMAIMQKNGQPSAVPGPSSSYAKIPESLRKFATAAGSR
jgi:molybdate/tungstate transport system substrate-binding protein